MTDKLSKKELLKEVKKIFDSYLEKLRDYPSGILVEQACDQIVALIKKPEVTEEWIGEKARELYRLQFRPEQIDRNLYLSDCRNFIRSLVEEING